MKIVNPEVNCMLKHAFAYDLHVQPYNHNCIKKNT